MSERYVQVALPLPLANSYTYRVPEALGGRAAVGARVVVPVRRTELIGIVTAIDVAAPSVAARDALNFPDAEPAVPFGLVETARWVAGYYGAPLGLTLRRMLPAGMWGRSTVIVTLVDAGRAPTGAAAAAAFAAWLTARGGEGSVSSGSRALKRPLWDAVTRLVDAGAITVRVESPNVSGGARAERVLALPDERPTLLEREASFRRRPRQRELYEALETLGGRAPVRHLIDRLSFTDALIRALAATGLARVERAELLRDPFAGVEGSPPPRELTGDQAAALHQIDGLAAGQGALLFGVTGSGKTLVYIEAVRRVLAAGGGAIVLVPEIGLTPQAVSRFRGAFGDEVAVLHSALSDGERADAWRALRRGMRRVAVGARSAIFAPVTNLALIVVDEEHDASYKNGEAPRYNTRDVAAVRARIEGARLILGSATPSLETLVRAGSDLALVELPERVGSRPLPPVDLIDLRTAPKVAGVGPLVLSTALDDALLACMARGEQALLLLNRRGFAGFLQCPDCGDVWQCPNCSISLTVHQSPAALRCHYCGHTAPMPEACRSCGNALHAMRGVGTQQLERAVAARYPEARIARMDLDTTSTKWSHQRILGAVERGEIDILIGTQMVAKGLDFPNVTLVGVVDADAGLHLPDFRSAERTFQLLAQVAGRAGRGPKGGRVLVQTRNPSHHALVWAARHDTEGFLREELQYREHPPYPPTVALANIIVSGASEPAVSSAAAALADWCQALLLRHALPVTVLGPAPCPLVRIKERWRWHVLLKGPGREIGRIVRHAARKLRHGGEITYTVDRDPASVL